MHKLTQFRLCPLSRTVRLVLGEYGIECELVEEKPCLLSGARRPAADLFSCSERGDCNWGGGRPKP